MNKTLDDKIFNCIIGGAIGDAFGFPVRYMEYDNIVTKYGKYGIKDIEVDCDNKARISDNTQLGIFTSDALIRSFTKDYLNNEQKFGEIRTYTSYLRWQYAQNRRIPSSVDTRLLEDNYLMDIQELKYDRCGELYIKQILENELIWDKNLMDNVNAGYLCLTKTHPIGIVYYKDENQAFDMAVKIAKLTHGHPSAYLSCGVLSAILSNILQGNSLEKSISNSIKILKKQEHYQPVLHKINKGLKMASEEIHFPEKLDDFGKCDRADDLLSASIYVSLISQHSFSEGILFATNNNCMSNNIASIVGNILGAYKGLDKDANKWAQKIELNDLFKQIANDLSFVSKKELPKEKLTFDTEIDFYEYERFKAKDVSINWLKKYNKE